MVALSPLAGAGWQFFGNNGLPLAGGKLYTYAAGTTTPLAAYTSISGVTPHANPIILDSAGRVPSEVWLTAGSNYKFTLKTSANVEIWTKDNIPGIITAADLVAYVTYANLASTATGKGAALTGFIQSGTGTVARTVLTKERDIVSVKDFGAVGDGVTDDSAAFIAAIQSLNSRVPVFTRLGDGQAELYVPEGAYRLTQSGILSNTGVVTRSGYKMRGAGRESTVIWLDCTDGVTKYLYDNGATQRNWGCTYESITFAGGQDWHRKDAGGTTLGLSNLNAFAKGFKISGPNWESSHHFIDCYWRYFDQVFEWAGSNNADVTTFTACNFNRNKNHFLMTNPQALSHSFSDCYIEASYGNVLVYGAATAGGGGFNWKGGAIIQLADAAVDTYVVNIPTTTTGPDIGNANITFSDLHIEVRDATCHLYKVTGTGIPILAFEQCQILSTAVVQKEYGEVSGYGTVIFNNCAFKEQLASSVTGYHTISGTIGTIAVSRRGKNAALRFLGACILQDDFFDADIALATARGATKATKGIVWQDGHGLLEVDDACYSVFTDLTAQPRIKSLACTVAGLGEDNYTVGRSGKVRAIDPFYSNVPSPLIAGTQVLLPPFVRIYRAWMRLNGTGLASATNVRLNISNGDKSVLYGQNTAQPINTAGGHFLAVNIYIRISDDDISRTLTFWLDNGAGADANSNVTAGVLVGGVEYV